jgi:hypothetical protein
VAAAGVHAASRRRDGCARRPGSLDPQAAGVVRWFEADSASDGLLQRDVPAKLVLTIKETLQ